MNAWPARTFALSECGCGVSCDANGASIESVPLLKRTHTRGTFIWLARDADAVSKELSAHFGLPIDVSLKTSALNAIARALNDGNIARAQLVTLHMQFPDS